MLYLFRQLCQRPFARFNAAFLFYTALPLPQWWPVEFEGIAQFAPIVGLGMAGCLWIIWTGLTALGLSSGLVAVIVVAIWLRITGGLHLDGAMDAADGLAVMDPERRLAVMSDSRSGAFGVMAAIVILAGKTVALASLSQAHLWVLLAVCGWSRWGQLAAIVRYPYIKPQGKGAFHRATLTSPWQALPLFLGLFGLGFLPLCLGLSSVKLTFALTIGAGGISLCVGDWFNAKLGGQTGDTYGAIVEWSEVLILVLANVVLAIG
ncbi:adenosylcobinamide-GDP ribazoletransferase [filamentous cyanobacterium LEGE 11480]|uniref:Adenosylcobinamide-GDP ribazoletransferase n=1 Tax=Romeriopsis navalis LEGE 11480 TaxID=2777977 RepID=A0A928Z2E7_9CYAN|nr:adenosylcobinamide-GDP ribazoletransferase [Romeriopsis navalis]MBE9029464.1 adenosylcobinamide-GDP ribazoletransferase [Romeriopsis navalis LEGE 11480]